MDEFFVLQQIVGSSAETAYVPVGASYGDTPTCPICDRVVSLMLWLPPYRARLRALGRTLGDIAFLTGEYVVSKRFVDLFVENDLKGIAEFPSVEIVRITPKKFSHDPQPYFLMTPRRFTARIDLQKTVLVRKGEVSCSHCLSGGIIDAVGRVELEEGSWGGEDIFIPWGLPGATLVSARLVELASKHDIKNFTVVPATEYRRDPLRRLRD